MVTEPAGELPEIRKREVSERLEQICPYHTGLLQICTGTRYLPFTLYRARKKAVENLSKLQCDLSIEDRLLEAIRIFAGYRFSTVKGLTFRYSVSGNEIIVDLKKKSIVRSSVNIALQKAIEQQGRVSGPKGLGVYGASYLYPMFQRFGLLRSDMEETGG